MSRSCGNTSSGTGSVTRRNGILRNMARPKSKTPTPGEIEILQIFWQHGPGTVKDVHQQLVKKRRVAHTTVASMVQLMEGKGQLRTVHRVRPFRYEAILGPDGAKDSLLNDLADRLFEGSVKKLVLHLASSQNASNSQLHKLEKVLSELR